MADKTSSHKLCYSDNHGKQLDVKFGWQKHHVSPLPYYRIENLIILVIPKTPL
jgi:hypothetical protein